MKRSPWAAALVALATGCATQTFTGLDEDDASIKDPVDAAVAPEDAGGGLVFDVVREEPDVPRAAPDAVDPSDATVSDPDVVGAIDAPLLDLPAAMDRPAVCAVGTVRCGDRCANLASDPLNCGRCGQSCPIGQACLGGFCEDPCPAPRSICNGSCTDTSVDPDHCGRCNNPCPTGTVCVAAACASRCAAPRVTCAGACVDVTSDPANCGACGNRCASGSSCVAGRCSAPSGSVGVGGACARTADCLPGWVCQSAVQGWPGGYCMRPGCTRDSECGAGGTCLLGSTQSACFASCISSSQCRTGYACVHPDPTDPYGICFPNCALNVPVICGEYACNAGTSLCTGGCTSSLQCSLGSVCRGGDCYCTTSTNCGPNRRCYVSPYGTCGCANDLGCAPDARCDTSTGECVAR